MASEFKCIETGYGLTLDSFEWQMDLRWVTRQDAKTSISLALTMIDGDTNFRSRLIPTSAGGIKEAVGKMVKALCRGWVTGTPGQMITAFEAHIDAGFREMCG